MLKHRLVNRPVSSSALSRRPSSNGQMSNSWHKGSPDGSSFDSDNFRVLELFSGIGCMHHALHRVQSLVPKKIYVESVDINTSANGCYAQCFPDSPLPHTFSLDMLTSDLLDQYRPEALFLSPPCQPYTMTCNAVRRDEQDPRARSTLVLTECLSRMAIPPRYLVMEVSYNAQFKSRKIFTYIRLLPLTSP